MATSRPPLQNSAQLRNEIDRGETGDKVAAPDPAAAPLGTDDEAAGVGAQPLPSEARPHVPAPGLAARRKKRIGLKILGFAIVLTLLALIGVASL